MEADIVDNCIQTILPNEKCPRVICSLHAQKQMPNQKYNSMLPDPPDMSGPYMNLPMCSSPPPSRVVACKDTHQSQLGYNHPSSQLVRHNKNRQDGKRGRLNTAAFYDAGLWTRALSQLRLSSLPFPPSC
ncbi:hypothetical protein M419DRAFT_121609 [Trichoderma reesei RUT C-30]|uniref:Uncharacterized protein n=1 Tax=Hypocrea jecorina (strain ATCC 56765 / BCRC 32924 / NRRL 11460 / Rut C-30) TaxID=1344414 RepID=A0A024SKU2_HYPJR|nr:hypothetical protein M419DRAFT_121609 [Trichoderma reesei RUT C-30]